jgi:hypothetical protein
MPSTQRLLLSGLNGEVGQQNGPPLAVSSIQNVGDGEQIENITYSQDLSCHGELVLSNGNIQAGTIEIYSHADDPSKQSVIWLSGNPPVFNGARQ